jgi:hypothetical protein
VEPWFDRPHGQLFFLRGEVTADNDPGATTGAATPTNNEFSTTKENGMRRDWPANGLSKSRAMVDVWTRSEDAIDALVNLSKSHPF